MARSLQFCNDQGKANFDEKMAPPGCGDFYVCGRGNISLTVVPRPTVLSMVADPP
jgi:hypothetical protein